MNNCLTPDEAYAEMEAMCKKCGFRDAHKDEPFHCQGTCESTIGYDDIIEEYRNAKLSPRK